MISLWFEAQLTRAQVEELARLMAESRGERPAGVLGASLFYERETARLVAVWRDRDTLDRYLSQHVPRGTELMRKVGAEPVVRLVECLESA